MNRVGEGLVRPIGDSDLRSLSPGNGSAHMDRTDTGLRIPKPGTYKTGSGGRAQEICRIVGTGERAQGNHRWGLHRSYMPRR